MVWKFWALLLMYVPRQVTSHFSLVILLKKEINTLLYKESNDCCTKQKSSKMYTYRRTFHFNETRVDLPGLS